MTQQRIAITHASSLLAEALLEQMATSGIEPDAVVLLDQSEQAGNRLSFGDTYITVLDQYDYDYEDLTAILLLQADTELQDLLQHADCFVISHFEEENVAPRYFDSKSEQSAWAELQPGPIKLASAELSTLLSVLKPLKDMLEFHALQVVNILSASIQGKSAVDELASQTIELLNGREVTSAEFPLQLAFNMIPQSDSQLDQKNVDDLFGGEQVSCSIQNILVPAFHGLSISVVLESNQVIDLKGVKGILQQLPSVSLKNEAVSPYTHCKEENKWIIFGLNQPQNDSKRLQFWIVADSVRNGLLNNYQNIIEFLLNSHL